MRERKKRQNRAILLLYITLFCILNEEIYVNADLRDNPYISGSQSVENIFIMNDMRLSPVGSGRWAFEFSNEPIEDSIDFEAPFDFEVYITFRDSMGAVLYNMTLQENWFFVVTKHTYYIEKDLSEARSVGVSTNLPPYTPGQTATPSTATPTPTATAQPTPTHTAENTSAPQPTRDVSVTAEPVSTPNIPGETEPSQAPGITPTERPATPTQGTQLPSETASPTPSPTLPVTAKPSGTPVPTAQPQVPTPTRLPGTTDMPTASPTANPTQTPAVSKPGKTKLMRPVIRIKTRKIDNKMWMAEIRLKKYQGTDIQIYYRRGKGKFKKIKLRRHNIKKNKKIFKVGYKKGNKIIYLRVRTYQKKGGKMWYSRYSKIRRLS